MARSSKSKWIFIVISCAAALSVAACGGGGGSVDAIPPADPYAKYQGTWLQACDALGTTSSIRYQITFSGKQLSGREEYYQARDCTGSAIAIVTESPDDTYVITKSNSSVEDEVTITRPAKVAQATGSAVSTELINGQEYWKITYGSSGASTSFSKNVPASSNNYVIKFSTDLRTMTIPDENPSAEFVYTKQ